MKQKTYPLWLVFSLIVSFILTGCKSEGGFGNINETSPLVRIEIIAGPILTKGATDITVAVGFTQSYKAIGHYADGSQKDITNSVKWTTSDPSIATMSKDGIFTAIKAGNVSVSASLDSVEQSTPPVVTTDAVVTSIQVTPAELKLPKGATKQLIAEGTFSDNTSRDISNVVTWASTDPNVASVDKGGVLTALSSGHAEIMATYDNIVSNHATVEGVDLSRIEISSQSDSVADGLTTQLSAFATLSDGTTTDVTTGVNWHSSNDTIATIDKNGVVTGQSPGQVTLTASIDNTESNTVSLTVTNAKVVSIAVAPGEVSKPKGLTCQLETIATLTDGTTSDVTAKVTWASNNTAIATVNEKGLLTAVSQGDTTVTASFEGKTSNSITVTITDAELVSVDVTPKDVTLPYWKIEQLSAKGTFTDSSTKDVTADLAWESSDTAIATVSQAGLVKGLTQPGSAGITASLGGIKSLPVTITNREALIDYLKASNTEAGDEFGWSVALSADGNTLAVGASYEDSNAKGVNGDQSNNSAPEAGAVYVFTRSGTTWSQQAYLKASNTEAKYWFGRSVALSADGNTLAVGAERENSNAKGVNNTAAKSGAVYVFTRSGTTWSQQAYIKASNTGAGHLFGTSVALSADGNTLAVGALHEDSNAKGVNGDQSNNSASEAGAVYVFTRSGITWSQQAYLKASNTEAGDWFGRSVALSADGNTLAVGALHEDSNAKGVNGSESDNLASEAGAVYVFTRSGTTWSQQAYLKASNTEAGDWFGRSVALSADGNTLAVGGYDEDSNTTGVNGSESNNSAAKSGAVYVFTRTENSWSQQAYIKASNTGAGDLFGTSVALSEDGNTLAVGAAWEGSSAMGVNGDQSNNSASRSGAVYVFTRSGITWSQQAYIKASNTEAGDWFGVLVALSADGNTLAVGANYEDSNAKGVNGDQSNNSVSRSGAVYVY